MAVYSSLEPVIKGNGCLSNQKLIDAQVAGFGVEDDGDVGQQYLINDGNW